jgi:hypothetical protein
MGQGLVPRPRFELGTPAFSVRCSTKLSYLGTADDCIGRADPRVRGILSRVKQVVGWLWMGGAIAALIAIQAFRQSRPLALVDNALNRSPTSPPCDCCFFSLWLTPWRVWDSH